ncbi:tapasin-like isoform X1 [Aquarana catesbeiana]|uniref:tapasin-like isoform X1 n=1 Tax=Aquarana catesbeiana TaxID=8400 RepID=UPI003CC97959
MSPLGFLWLIFLQHTGAALGYVLFTHSARRGSNTTIPCKFDVNAVPPAQRTFSVIWHFQEKEIFRYPNNPEVLNSRLSIDQDRIKDGTADLYMSGVSISDGGLYKCSMTQIPGEKEKEIRLDVYAPPRITITGENIFISKENVLSCAISGFYPVDIDIKWLRDGIILNNITLEKPQRDPDGTYSVRSSVTIIPTEEDRKRIFSCRIQHESLTTPLQEDFQLVYGDSTDTKSSTLYIIIIPVIAGVVILIIIAAVAILCVKRKGKKNHNKVKNGENQEKKLMASNLQDQNKHHEDNQENQKENLLANNPLGNITYICTFTFSLCTFAI